MRIFNKLSSYLRPENAPLKQFDHSSSDEVLFMNHPDAMFAIDSKGQILSINRKFEDLTGYNLRKAKTFHVTSLFDLSNEQTRYHIHKSLHGISSSIETSLNHKTGKRIFVEITFLSSGKEKNLDLIFVLCRDITAIKKYESKISILYENLAQTQEISNIGSWNYDLIHDETFWSKQTYQIFQIEDPAFCPTWDSIFQYIHPKDRQRFKHDLDTARDSGNESIQELQIIRCNGEEGTIIHHTKVLQNERGQIIRIVGTIQDITVQQALEWKIKELDTLIQTVSSYLHLGICSFDKKKNKLSFCSNGMKDLFGLPPSAGIEEFSSTMDLVHPEDRPTVKEFMKRITNGEELVYQFRMIDRNGNVKWLSNYAIPHFDDDGSLLRIDGIMKDITEEKDNMKILSFITYYDFLTKLPNRNYLAKKLNKYITKYKKEGSKFAILNLDLDHFKNINDTFGYSVGDQILVQFSNRIKNIVGSPSILARIGGDKFAICLWNIHEVEDAISVAKNIITEMELPFFVDSYEVFVTVSIGISIFPLDGEDSETLLIKADYALNDVKKLFGNDWQVFLSTRNIESFKRYQLDRDLRKGLLNNEFYVVYQPKVDIKTGKIISAEALIRWKHEDWGVISPNEFFKLADKNGIGFKMGDWILKEVCLLLEKWQKEGVPVVPISVNVSPKRLLKDDFVKNVKETIQLAGIDPSLIELELTEQAIVSSSEKTKDTISQLKDFGVRFVLDDFGTGFSSLSYLVDLDIDTLKIDKSFIDGIGLNKANESIIKSSIFLAKELGMEVVAEGVETKEQLDFLLQQECPQVQGYIFSKPVQQGKFKNLLRKGIIQPKPIKKTEAVAVENRRKYYRLNFLFPLCADMTIIRFKNKEVNLGKSKSLIQDISLGGLKYVSNINLPVQEDFVLKFTTTLFHEQFQFVGKNVWKQEISGGLYQYGFEFIMSDKERSRFAPIFNQLLLQLKKNPLLPGCDFLREDEAAYFHNREKSL